MCEIQFIKNKKGNLSEEDIREFLLLMELGASHNKDSFGYFNSNVRFKLGGRFIPNKIKFEDLDKDNFLVGHNRFATDPFMYSLKGGDSSDFHDKNINNHPFHKGDLTLVHQGVISNNLELWKKYKIKTKIVTDSYAILYLIDYYFKKSKKVERVNKMVDAIKKATNELIGYYSVFIFDEVEKNLFYFKDYRANFYFCNIGDKVLCGSTSKDNLKKIYPKEDKDFFKPVEETIYLIDYNSKKVISKVGFINEKENIIKWMEKLSTQNKESYLFKRILKIIGFMPTCIMNEDKELTILISNSKERKKIINSLNKYLIKFKSLKGKILLNLEEIYNE